MEPVHHSSCNMVLIGDGTDKVRDIPACYVTNEDGSFNSIASFWKPSEDELKLLNSGGVMTLYLMTTQIPPVWLAVNRD